MIADIELEQKLASYQGEDQVLPSDEVLSRYRRDFPPGQEYKSGLPGLDKIIGGFYPGQLIVISGITGQGKTTLAQTFTHTLSEQGLKPLWFTFEVPVDDFLRMFDSSYHPQLMMPAKLKDNTLTWIEERLIESNLKYNTQCLFIDHLHFLVAMNPKANMSAVIGETVRGLKLLAIKHRMIVFLIAHMQKTKPDEEPGLGHVRDSSFIEQESDTVLYVWRAVEDKKITVLKIAKNRKRGIIDERIPLLLVGTKYEEKAYE